MVAFLDPNDRIEYINDAGAYLLDSTPLAVKGTDIKDYLVLESRVTVLMIKERWDKGDPGISTFEISIRLRKKSLPLRATAFPMVKDGKLQGYILRAIDISGMKEMEKSSIELFEKYRTIVENSHEGIIVVGEDFRFEYVNDKFCEMVGLPKEKILGEDFRKFLEGKNKRMVIERYKKRQRGEKVPDRYEFEMIRANGEKIIVELSARVLKDSSGKKKTYAQLIDITEQKKAVEKANHLYRTLQAIRNVNQLITREKNPIALTEKICKTLTENRGYTAAWLVLLDEEGEISHMTGSGIGKEFANLEEILKNKGLTECCRRAMGISGLVLIKKTNEECKDCQLYNRYDKGCVLSSRLEYDGKIYGMLCVLLPTELAYDKEEHALFVEVVGDISFALHSIQLEKDAMEARKKIEEQGKYYRALFEGANDGIFIMDRYNIVECNKKSIDMFGCDVKEDIIGHSPWEFSPARQENGMNSKEMAIKVIDAALLGEPQRFYWKHMKKNGVLFDAEVTLTKIETGSKEYLQAIVRDITEQREAEKKLRLSEERYRSTFNDSPISLWEEDFSRLKDYIEVLKENGVTDIREYLRSHPEEIMHCISLVKVIDINRRTVELYGASDKKELLGNIDKILHERALPAVVEMIVAIAEGRRELMLETINRTLKGEELNMIIKWTVSPGCEMDYSRVLLSIIDITKQKKTEKNYKTLFEESLDAIYITSRDGRFIEFNPAALRLFGYTKEEILKQRVEILYADPKDRERFQQEIEKKGYVKNFEITLKRKDGSIMDCLLTTVVKRDLSGKIIGYQGIIRDITEQKRTLKELARYRQHLEEVVEQKSAELRKTAERLIEQEKLATIGLLAGHIAQEIRHPLSVIKNAIYLWLNMREKDNEIKPEIRKYRDIIFEEIKRVDTIIEDLLAVSREVAPLKHPTEPARIIEEAVSSISVPDNVEIVLDMEPGIHMVSVDPAHLKKILHELILNSLQAIQQKNNSHGKIIIRTERLENQLLKLSIIDTGNGIPEKIRQRIFEPLFSTRPRGMGLGLYTVRRLLDAGELRFDVDSEQGKGTTFTIYLPLVSQEMEEKTIE